MKQDNDLLIVGGGPSGLSAAINGASEGLRVLLLDAGLALGGQARESAAIENYPGFPDGITGDALMGALVRQAHKFDARAICPVGIMGLAKDDDWIILYDDHGTEYVGKACLLTLGLSYRRLNAKGLAPFMGRGAFYGLPDGRAPTKKCQIVVVGGANSAGQAVLNLARNPRATIRMLIRKTIETQMSKYLVDRILANPQIEVCENCEVVEVHGVQRLEAIRVRDLPDNTTRDIPCDYMYVYIGAVPKTYWLRGVVQLDGAGFIDTWTDVRGEDLEVAGILPYETSMDGVFAAGDVRSSSIKRIAAASGEGASALQMVHKWLS